MAKTYPIDEIRDHIEHVKELEAEIDRLKDEVNDLESDMESADWDKVTTEGQLGECEKDYKDARDTAAVFGKLLKGILDRLSEIKDTVNEEHQSIINVLIKEINYTL